MKTIVEQAEQIARQAHKGQTRWGGEPYIIHPQAVAESVYSETEKAAAWLHDVLEDTQVTKEELHLQSIPESVIQIVELLTRCKDETYFDHIIKLIKSENQRAINVKLADLQNNMSTLKEGSLKDKYRLAHYILDTI